MRTFIKHAAVAVVVLGLGNLACDKLESETRQTDRKVDAAIEEAMNNQDAGLAGLRTGLTQAASQSTASPLSQARAYSMLGNVEVQMANQLMPKIDDGEVQMAHLISDIRQLGDSIASGNALITGYKKFDADEIKKAASAKIAQAQGDANAADWVKSGDKPLPTLSAVNQGISRLEGEINKKQDQLKDLTSKRDEIAKQAAAADQQSRDKSGKESLDLYKSASDLRKKAADVGIEIAKVEALVAPMQADLAVAQAQKVVLNEAVGQFEEQSQLADKNAASVNEQSDAQAKVSQSIGEGATPSITSKSAALAELAKSVKTDRDEAATLLTSAIEHFVKASAGAKLLELELGTKLGEMPSDAPDRAAIENRKATYNPAKYNLAKANAQQSLAMLQMREAELLERWVKVSGMVKNVMQQAGLKAPASLISGEVATELSKAKTDAETSFHDSHDSFQDVIGAPLALEGDKNAAKVSDILALYSWSQFEDETGNKAAGTAHKADAIAARKAAKDESLALPALPSGIAEAVAVPKAASTPTPTPAPAAAAPVAAEADPTLAAEVRKSLGEFIDSALSGDQEAFKSHIHATIAQQGMVNMVSLALSGAVKLHTAVQSKFGDPGVEAMLQGLAGPQMKIPKVDEIKQQISMIKPQLAMIPVSSTGPDNASMGMPNQPTRLTMKKMDGVWKIDLEPLSKNPQFAQGMAAAPFMLKPIAEGINTVAANVDAGKYTTVDEVVADLKKLIPQMPGMTAPAGGVPNVAIEPTTAPAAPQ